MGDFIAVLERLGVSSVNSVLLAIILWLVWKLYQRFESLEGQCGIIQQLRDHLAEHDTHIEVCKQRLSTIETAIERLLERGDRCD